MRIVSNLGIAIGPAIGGFIATRSYLVLFVLAGVASLLYGILVLLRVKETNPASVAKEEGQVEEPAHYGAVLKDSPFLMFSLLMLISTVVYAQMNTTLPVYLKNGFNVSESWYGLLMSLNAAMVVVFQYSVTRWVSKKASGLVMALGMLFYAVGFGMFGFIGTLPLFFLAQAIWTTGELIVSPTSQAFVANAAPRTLRGTYMGIFGITWGIGYGLGPLLGGLAMDGLGGQYIWYAAFGLDLLVVLAFIAFNRTMVAREKVSLQ
jgi:MFS family permease